MSRKRNRKVTLAELPQGDPGPNTEMQRSGATITRFREDNGAWFLRKRRDHALEIMRDARRISTRQCDAGMILNKAFCKTELSPPSAFTKEVVDFTPDYGALILKRAELSGGFGRLYYAIPKAMRGPVNHVAVLGLMLRFGNDYVAPYSRDGHDESSHRAQLQVALDLLGNLIKL